MICKQCGTEIPDETKFCPNCGTAVDAGVEETAVVKAETNAVAQSAPGSSTPVLVWGILGLAFAVSFYLSFLGIIFSAVAKGKAKEYFENYGVMSGKARVGKGLSKAGMIVGIINTALLVLVLVFTFVGQSM